MDDTDIHSGIPLGHKLFAFLLAAAVAGAGCAWLIYRSNRSAATAVLAFHPALAQSVDSGIASARHPAVALADSLLNDQTVANLAKQAHLASSTPAGQIGEFRSDLQLTQPSALRLGVRFQAADSSQSLAVANAVARTLAAGNPASAMTAPSAPPQSAAPSAPPVQQAAPANQGQSSPSAAAAPAATQPTPANPVLPDHPLSDALNGLGAQLSATNQRVEQLAAGGATYSESAQQSLIRSEVENARRALRGLRAQYAKEVADPNIGGRLDEIQQALDSILPGTGRYGFNAAGVSARELSAERANLLQAVDIVDRETKRIQAAEAAHPASNPQPGTATTPPPPPAAAAESSPAPSAAPSSSSGIQEQNLGATPAGSSPQQPSQSPLSIVHPAAAAPRPPLWPAFVAGAVFGLLYLGIAALAYRRRGSDDVYLELSSAPQRMITPVEPIRRDEWTAAPPEPPRLDTGPRHRAAFDFQPAPPERAAAPVEKPAAPAGNPPAPLMKPAAPAAAPAGTPAAPVEATASPVEPIAVPVASVHPVAESVAAPAEAAAPAAAISGNENESALVRDEPSSQAHISPPEPATGTDPVAERMRKSLAETAIGRSLEGSDRPGPDQPPSSGPQRTENRDWLDEWLSPSGKSTSRS